MQFGHQLYKCNFHFSIKVIEKMYPNDRGTKKCITRPVIKVWSRHEKNIDINFFFVLFCRL